MTGVTDATTASSPHRTPPVEGTTAPTPSDTTPVVSARISRLVLLVGFVVAGLPYVLACWRAWRQGWMPTGDNARLAADAVAVKSTSPPLLGLASDSLATTTGISPVHHPGPFETWILGAVHLVVPGTGGFLVGVLLIGLAAVLLSLLAARALWGVGGVAVTAMCVSVAASSLGTMVLATPWNPYITILPSAAFVLCAWAWLLGRWAPGLPAAVLLACFCAQTHITEIPVAAAAIAPLIVLLLARRWLPFTVPTPPHGRWLVGGSIVAALATWIPPVYFELTGPYSNLSNLARASLDRGNDPALGTGFGVNTVSRIVAAPPPWGPRPVLRQLWGEPFDHRNGALIGLALVVALVAVVGALAFRRRDAVAVGTTISSLSSIAAAVYLLSISTFLLGAAVYQSRWVWAIFVTIWSGVLSAIGRLVAPAWFGVIPASAGSTAPTDVTAADQPRRSGWTIRRPVALAVGLALLAGALLRVVAPGGHTDLIDPDVAIEAGLVRELTDGVKDELPRSTKLALSVPPMRGQIGRPAHDLFEQLQLAGYDVQVITPLHDATEAFGRGNVYGGERERVHLRVVRRDDADPARVVASVASLDRSERAERARLRARLTREIEAGNLAWTEPGRLLAYGSQPTPEFLLKGSQLLGSLQAGILTGDLPSLDDARRWAELEARADSGDSPTVERLAAPAS